MKQGELFVTYERPKISLLVAVDFTNFKKHSTQILYGIFQMEKIEKDEIRLKKLSSSKLLDKKDDLISILKVIYQEIMKTIKSILKDITNDQIKWHFTIPITYQEEELKELKIQIVKAGFLYSEFETFQRFSFDFNSCLERFDLLTKKINHVKLIENLTYESMYHPKLLKLQLESFDILLKNFINYLNDDDLLDVRMVIKDFLYQKKELNEYQKLIEEMLIERKKNLKWEWMGFWNEKRNELNNLLKCEKRTFNYFGDTFKLEIQDINKSGYEFIINKNDDLFNDQDKMKIIGKLLHNEKYIQSLHPNLKKFLKSYETIEIKDINQSIKEELIREMNHFIAKELFSIGVKEGYPESINNLGLLYQKGFGVEKNISKAIHYYEQAIELKSSAAYINLGNLYHFETSIKKDSKKAINYYKKAYELGNYNSLNMLGVLHVKENNFNEAEKYLKLGTELKVIEAELNLGCLYYNQKKYEKSS